MKCIVCEVSMIFTECGKHSIFDARLHYLAIAWFHHVTFYFYHVTFIVCIILDILENVWKFLLSFLITLTIHFLDILDDVWKFLLLFLITLTIHLLSPRNYSFKTFLTSEKIKEKSGKKSFFLIPSCHIRNLILKLEKLLGFSFFNC